MLFDGVALPDLWEVRMMFPGHLDLWDAVRDDLWAALLCMTDPPAWSRGM
ncbi:hypothetical protein ACLMAJ_27340 [Nocardia sp. KC 131]